MLEFNTKDKILEGATRTHENNLVAKPTPTNDATKKIKLIPNGLRDLGLDDIQGFITITDDDGFKKLINFPILAQVDATHEFGIFGLDYPNATRFNFNPTTTLGLSIKSIKLVHNPKAKIIEFTLSLQFAGTLIADSPYDTF